MDFEYYISKSFSKKSRPETLNVGGNYFDKKFENKAQLVQVKTEIKNLNSKLIKMINECVFTAKAKLQTAKSLFEFYNSTFI